MFRDRAIIRQSIGVHQLDRAQPGQLPTGRQQAGVFRAGCELGSNELAGGDVGGGDSGAGVVEHDRGNEIVAVGIEHRGVGDGAGGDHARDITLDQSLRFGRVADLLTYRYLVPGGDQPADIPLGRVVGNTGHGHAGALAHLPAGQDDIEHLGGNDRVVLEGLVEIAQPEEEEHVGITVLDIEVLPAERHHAFAGSGFPGGTADRGFSFGHAAFDRSQRTVRSGGGRVPQQDTLPVRLATFACPEGGGTHGVLCALHSIHR